MSLQNPVALNVLDYVNDFPGAMHVAGASMASTPIGYVRRKDLVAFIKQGQSTVARVLGFLEVQQHGLTKFDRVLLELRAYCSYWCTCGMPIHADALRVLVSRLTRQYVGLTLADAETAFDDVEVLYFWPVISFKEFLSILLHDGLLAIGSIVFVFFYLWIHSGSAFLAMAGMLHVMMSFPLAFLLYRYLFGIMPFYILSFLSIYIILAIGADDIFVYMDAWRQSAFEGPEVNLNLHTRMAYTFKRAAKAVSC